jgi:hypothetical protein
MNALVLINPLARFYHNEQMAITRAKMHTFLEWDRLQVDLQYTLELLKLALVMLASSHILRLFGMTTWGVGAIPLNVQTWLESFKSQIQGLVCFVFENDVIVRKVYSYGCSLVELGLAMALQVTHQAPLLKAIKIKEIVSKKKEDKLERVS